MGARTPVPSFEEVQASLSRLDGTPASAVSLLTGLSTQEIADLGGLPEEPRTAA